MIDMKTKINKKKMTAAYTTVINAISDITITNIAITCESSSSLSFLFQDSPLLRLYNLMLPSLLPA
jgi:hypothetical protein